MSLTLDELDSLIAVREDTGMMVAEAWMIAHHPQWDKARELVEAGELGALRRVVASFTAPLFDPDDFRNKPGGGGALRDLGVYVLGAARLVTGEEPQELLHVSIDWDNGVDATVEVLAEFPSFLFSGHVSMRTAIWQSMSIYGTEAGLEIAVPFNPPDLGEARIDLRNGPQVQQWRFPAINQYVRQVEAFNATIRDGKEYPLPLEFTRGTQAMVDAIHSADAPAPSRRKASPS